PHSKRKKIETDNEELRMLWNALKKGKVNEIESGQFLLFFDDVSYLTGDNEQGSKISTLFIRECYLHLFKIIFENINVRRWRITGNPGIGKIFFSYYLLCQLAQQNKMVVYHRYNKPPILFSEENIFSSSKDNIHEFRGYLKNRDVWYIVDGREPMEYVAKTILICSPQKCYYSTFDKLGTTIRYMPVWSWEETDTCRKQELLQKAINSVNDKILNFVGETTEDNSTSHKIVHIRTNVPQVGEKGKGVEEVEEISEVEENTGKSSSPAVTKPDKDNEEVPFYTLSNLDFASDYVYEKVMDVLLTNYKEQLQTFVQASKSISDYGTLRGTIFERITHGKLLNGGTFKVRPLFGKTTSCFGISNSNRKLTIPPRKKLLFSKPDEVIQNRYCLYTNSKK
ncbi:9774_t:CDS:2, partial [Ambispora gerdemannii]